MSSENVESALRSIASDRDYEASMSGYGDVSGALKSIGAPTNNVLLSGILAESKRCADEQARANSYIQTLIQQLSNLESIMQVQTDILSKISISGTSHTVSVGTKTQTSSSGEWYYQGTRLSSRYHVYACIISHLIDMVQIHMDIIGKQYPDSVDCDFKTLHNAVRIVCTERCGIPTVNYKNTILVKEKDSQPFDILYSLISSQNKSSPTTLSESMLSKISNPVTRPVIQDIEWIRQRLCFTDGILSAKQIDILGSIKNPLIRPGTESELNWDEGKIHPRTSHPLVKEISDLTAAQKNEYLKLRMKGRKLADAYMQASTKDNNK